MRIRFDCRHCGAGISASDWDSGRAITCAACRGDNIVPADKAPALDAGEDRVPNLAIGDASPLRLHRKNYFLWGVVWSGTAVAAIGVLFGGFLYLVSANRPVGNDLIVQGNVGVVAEVPEHVNDLDKELFKGLGDVPVKGLDRQTNSDIRRSRPKTGEHPLALAVAKNPSAGLGMPFTFGTDSTSPQEHSRELGKASVALHSMLDGRFARNDQKSDHSVIKGMENEDRWLKPENVPALTQILMAEDATWRMALVRMLKKIDGPAATRGLADRALFDLNADVRSSAVTALRNRPKEEYTERVMSAFRHPWAPAADHAAYAIAALERTDLEPALRELVDRPDPMAPTKKRVGIRDVTVAPQLVRVNHLRNCAYCHPVSTSDADLVRGVAPDWDQPLQQRYYGPSIESTFVRADMVYLRQDFSVSMPVSGEDCANSWPTEQRFDFFVCDRPVSAEEAAKYERPATYPQREAVKAVLAKLETIGTK